MTREALDSSDLFPGSNGPQSERSIRSHFARLRKQLAARKCQ